MELTWTAATIIISIALAVFRILLRTSGKGATLNYYRNEDGDIVPAMRLSPELVTVVSVWCGGRIVEEIDPFDSSQRYPALNVQCGNEVKRASLGDTVIKHSDGTFDVKKPNEFIRHFSPADD